MIELRKASPADARLLAETRQIVWQETYRGIFPDEKLDGYDVDFYEARDAKKLAQRERHYYLFLDGTKCIGYFSFGPYNHGTYKDFSLCLNHLYLLRDYQGRGLGKLAFAEIREYCKKQGIRKFFCGCNVNNKPAMGFYAHMGGIRGDDYLLDVPKEDQIIHFEFYVGEEI